jgi:exonuclease SbcD
MKVAHCADPHFQNKPVLDDIVKCSDYFVDTCLAEDVDLILIAGDLFHEGVQLGSPASLAAIAFVKKCGDMAPTIVIRGTSSHDAENSIAVLNDIKAAYPIYATDRLEQVGLCQDNVWRIFPDNEFPYDPYRVFISCLPSVNKAGVMAAHAAGAGIADTSRETMDLMRDIFQAWGVKNGQARETGIPTILIGHGTVTGSQLSTGQTMIGKDLEFTTGDLQLANCDLYCLGHIHKSQFWGNIFYSGDLTRLNHGETEAKGFYIHELPHTGNVGISRFIQTPARAMRTKRPEGLPGIEAVEDVQQGELIRIVYDVAEADIGKVDEQAIIDAALAKGAADVKIEKNIIPTVRIRAEGISRETHLEGKLMKWADTTGAGITKEIGEKLAVIETADVEKTISILYANEGGAV